MENDLNPDALAPITLSQSVLGKHRECPQKWHYEVQRGLAPTPGLKYPVALVLGSWWHALRAVEALTRGRALGSLVEGGTPETILTHNGGPTFDPQTATVEDVLEGARKFHARLTGVERESWLDQRGEPLEASLRRMDAAYTSRWHQARATEYPLAVELKFSREMGRDDAEGGTGRPLVLEGIADELYWDDMRRMVVLRDHKTARTLDAHTSAQDMMLSQMQVYAWGLAPTVNVWGRGPIRATSYDRVRTAVPSTPALTATGSLSKSVTDYDVETYRAWAATEPTWGKPGEFYVSGAKKGKPKFGTYAEDPAVIERLTTPKEMDKWQARTLVPLNRSIVQSHLRAAFHTALDVERSKKRVADYGETIRNLGRGCEWCPMAELCRAEMAGGPQAEYEPEEFGLYVRPARGR